MAQAADAGGGRPRVVIVGGGFGGLTTAKALAALDVDVTLVDQQNHHLFQPLLYQVATAGLSPADVAGPIRGILRNDADTRVLLDRVTGVDTGVQEVVLASGHRLAYDILVLATGAQQSYFGNDQWAAHALGLKTIDQATAIRRKILSALEAAENETDKTARDRLLTFVVVGGGPTGVEMAGAIAELTRHTVRMDFRHITPHCSKIVLVESGERLLAAFPETLSHRAKTALETLGCEIRLGARVRDVSEAGATLADAFIPCATIVWAAGVQASPAAQWLGSPCDPRGRAIVGPDLRPPGFSNVYVIGDTALVTTPDGRPVPGIAPAAKQMAQHVARSIRATVAGGRPPGPFRYRHAGNLATIGRKRAVIDFGAVRLSGLPAWLLWCTVHVYFLVGFRNRLIVGANWLWNYLTFDRGARLITGLTWAEDDAAREPPARRRPAATG